MARAARARSSSISTSKRTPSTCPQNPGPPTSIRSSPTRLPINGKLYGLTYWDTLGLVWVVNYNKTVFADNGITPPTTYAEFKAACEKLLAAGIQPVFEPVADGWHHVLWFNEVGPAYEAATPGLAAALNANDATFAGNELMLANLTQLKEMFDSGFLGENALADTFAEAPAKLAAGEIGMVVAPLAYAASIANDIPGSDPNNIGVFLMPVADNQIMNVNPGGPTMFIYRSRRTSPRPSSSSPG